MKAFRAFSSWSSIRPNGPQVVKGLAAALCLAALPPVSLSLAGTDPTIDTHDTDSFPPAIADYELNDIEAKTYSVQAIAKSESGHSYLFSDPSGAAPGVGKILLFKSGSEPVLAFRVLQSYPEHKRFVARRVRRYGKNEGLDLNRSYAVLERSQELALPPGSTQLAKDEQADVNSLGAQAIAEDQPVTPPESLETGASKTAQEQTDAALADLEKSSGSNKSAAPNEPTGGPDEPSAEAKAANSARPVSASAGDDDDVQGPISVSVDEVERIDRTNHWLTGEIGYLRNNNVDGGSAYYTGAGMRYGYSFGHFLFAKGKRVQDSIALEGSVFFYKVLGYAVATDSFQVIPLEGTLRYNIFPSETIGLFFYGGVVYNDVVSTANAIPGATENLGGANLAAGTGLIIRVGPNWEARVDLGFDMIGAGLMLRF